MRIVLGIKKFQCPVEYVFEINLEYLKKKTNESIIWHSETNILQLIKRPQNNKIMFSVESLPILHG